MKLGAVYPQTELAGDLDATRRFVRAVEDLGFDYLLAYDHVVGAAHDRREPKLQGPYTAEHPFHDPFVLFGYAAAMTERLGFATGVLILPQRQTVLAARQAADVDLLSNGRLRLGVGIGWNYVEYDALGQDFHRRGRRLEEQIGYMRDLWSSPLLSFEGAFDRIERAALMPRPKRQIPIWVGGWSEAAFQRAARVGDGFIFPGVPDKLAEAWGSVRRHLEAARRPAEDFGRDMITTLAGNPREAVDHLNLWRDLGGTHGCVPTMDKGLVGADAHIDYLAEVRRRFNG
jgi:probable F420-dependent oxidoreductase